MLFFLLSIFINFEVFFKTKEAKYRDLKSIFIQK